MDCPGATPRSIRPSLKSNEPQPAVQAFATSSDPVHPSLVIGSLPACRIRHAWYVGLGQTRLHILWMKFTLVRISSSANGRGLVCTDPKTARQIFSR